MAKIEFENKTSLRNSDLPEINKLTAANINEIKASVNNLYDNPSSGELQDFIIFSSGPVDNDSISLRKQNTLINSKPWYKYQESAIISYNQTNGTWELIVNNVVLLTIESTNDTPVGGEWIDVATSDLVSVSIEFIEGSIQQVVEVLAAAIIELGRKVDSLDS
jgi:hypothetical protein